MRYLLSIIFSLFLALGCSRNSTETGNPGVTINLSSYSENSINTNQNEARAVTQVTFCFKRLRFKLADDADSSNSDNIDLDIGQVNLDPNGGELTTVNVPAGIYDRIEFDLENDCNEQNEPSVIVDNDNDGGTPFQTDDRISIRFEGNLIVTSLDTEVNLRIGNIIDALDTITNANDIKDTLEDTSANGAF